MPWTIIRRAVTAVALLLTLSVMADAQELAGTFDQLRVLVKPGDTISVIDATGSATKGTIETLSPSSIALLASGRRRDFREDEVDSIRQRRPDSLQNGARWGLALGAGFGTLAGLALRSECSGCWSGWFVPFAATFYGAMGSGIGAGMDALINSPQVIYARSSRSIARVTLVPAVTGDRKGLMVSWRLSKAR